MGFCQAGGIAMSDKNFVMENELMEYADLFRKYCPPPLFVKKGTHLTRQCSTGGWLYYILDGILKTYTVNSRGNERIIDLMHENTVVGMDCLDPDTKAVVSIVCLTDAEVLPFTTDTLRRMIRENPDFGFAMVLCYGKVLRQVTYHSATLGVGSRSSRIANFLYLYTDTETYKKTQEVRLSQEDLASACGVSLSQAARTLRKLREEGILSTSSKRISVLDREGLARHCDF